MSNSSTPSGIGVVGALGVAFVVLKLTGFINWSWWWVTAPFCIPISIGVLIVVGFLSIALIFGSKRRR